MTATSQHVYRPGELIPGTVYQVQKKLGEGGMGVVYQVEDTSIGKVYVVKTVHLRHAGKDSYAELTRNEARMLATLRHRNIVQVITAGTTADANRLAYFVMEKLEGCTVATLRGVALPMPYVWQIGRELLDALQYVHHPKDDRAVIVHRDIKPENIFLAKVEEDEAAGSSIRHRVKLLDFGIGAVGGARSEGFWGTAKYASPEQLQLEPVTPKTDLYAAGVVLFELLTGRHPFEGARSVQEFMDAHRALVPPRVSDFVHVPRAVDDCIDAALSKLPDQRPKDAHKMLSALSELRNAERPARALGSTTIQDLNTVIERQTPGGYEAYATSARDTVDGMSRPPVEGGALLDVVSAWRVGPTAFRATEPAVLVPPPARGRGATVPMPTGQSDPFRQAPTRSLHEVPLARRPGGDTVSLEVEELGRRASAASWSPWPANAASSANAANGISGANPANAVSAAASSDAEGRGGTSVAVERSLRSGDGGEAAPRSLTTRTVRVVAALSLGVSILAALVIARLARRDALAEVPVAAASAAAPSASPAPIAAKERAATPTATATNANATSGATSATPGTAATGTATAGTAAAGTAVATAVALSATAATAVAAPATVAPPGRPRDGRGAPAPSAARPPRATPAAAPAVEPAPAPSATHRPDFIQTL